MADCTLPAGISKVNCDVAAGEHSGSGTDVSKCSTLQQNFKLLRHEFKPATEQRKITKSMFNLQICHSIFFFLQINDGRFDTVKVLLAFLFHQ